MGKIILITLSVFVFGTNAWSSDVEVSYEDVPTYQQRNADANYSRFPGWKRIEIVRDGVVNQLYTTEVFNNLNDAVDLESFKWLQVREFDILADEISVNDGEAVVPFAIGVRFQEKGTFSQIFFQGTVNSKGEFTIITKNGKVKDLEILSYDDSQLLEEFGRFVGAIKEYDGEFIKTVVTPVIMDYLNQMDVKFILPNTAVQSLD